MPVKCGNNIALLNSGLLCGGVLFYLCYIDTGRHIVGFCHITCDIDAADTKICTVCLIYLFLRNQILNDRDCCADRDRITDSLNTCVCIFYRVDTDDLACCIEQCTATVTRVDRCTGLDQFCEQVISLLLESITVTSRFNALMTRFVAD